MALHNSTQSMLSESLKEMVEVAEYCIDYRKAPQKWDFPGCFGYPAAILLFSITDTIGSYVLNGKTKDHFNILRNKSFYNPPLDDEAIKIIYKNYRNHLTHNAAILEDFFMGIGEKHGPVLGRILIPQLGEKPCLYLVPFLDITKNAVEMFLENIESYVPENKRLRNIIKKA